MRSQSSQRTHSDLMIFGPWIAPHSQARSQILHVLHSDQRLIGNTVVTCEMMPSIAPTGHRNRQYRLRTTSVATSRTASIDHSRALADRVNIQNGSTYRYTVVCLVTM